jgi:hypothetical protein
MTVEDAEDLIDSIIEASKRLHALPHAFGPSGQTALVARRYGELVAAQQALVAAGVAMARPVARRSPGLKAALEDLAWLQGELEQRARSLSQ